MFLWVHSKELFSEGFRGQMNHPWLGPFSLTLDPSPVHPPQSFLVFYTGKETALDRGQFCPFDTATEDGLGEGNSRSATLIA